MRKQHCDALPDFGAALDKDGARLSPISQATIIRLARLIGRSIAQQQALETYDVTAMSGVPSAVELPISEALEQVPVGLAASHHGTTSADAEPAVRRSLKPQTGTSVLGDEA